MNFLILFRLMNLFFFIKSELKRKRTKSYKNIQKLLKKQKADELLEQYTRKYGTLPSKLESATNEVYRLDCDAVPCILKKFLNDDFEEENKIALAIKFPRIYGFGEDYRLEKYVDHKQVDYQTDSGKIARAILSFHSTKLDGIKQFIPYYDTLLNKQLQTQIEYLDQLKCSAEKNLLNLSFDLSNLQKIFTSVHQKFINLINEHGLVFDKLCHNDLNHGNILKIKNNVVFIDFEFACISDPLLDIARFFYCTKYYYFYNHPENCSGLWNNEKKISFLKFYYENRSKIFLKNVLVKIESVEVITNYFNFLLCLKWLRQGNLEKANRRFRSLEGHLSKIKESKIINESEALIINQYIEFLKISINGCKNK
ncbi:choline kinase [Tubulinosema ratisbonensis]|uniref:ethanolamine kinase n=1 Tax=Tubulinosema ratisbonensis TaxID=291195 RepID=A0A437AIN4_9MICR|nr:choline kinase [Tubulinosema ratisbonensis]